MGGVDENRNIGAVGGVGENRNIGALAGNTYDPVSFKADCRLQPGIPFPSRTAPGSAKTC